MTAERVTVSLPPDVLRSAREAVAAGAAESLSAFVADALRNQLTRAHALAELERVLGGRPPREVLDTVRRDLGLASA
jgi:antitoxin ParD1/3/4